MAERLNAPVLKTGRPVRVSGVRIPLSPLYQSQSGSRNRRQTPLFDEGCGCVRLGVNPHSRESMSHQSSSMVCNGCQKNRQPLVQPNRSQFRSIRRSMCPSSPSLKAAKETSAERRHQGRRDWQYQQFAATLERLEAMRVATSPYCGLHHECLVENDLLRKLLNPIPSTSLATRRRRMPSAFQRSEWPSLG